MGKVLLLDCTLRDGGLGLEDAAKTSASTLAFAPSDIRQLTSCLATSKIEIIEIGAIEISDDDKCKYAIYQSIEHVSEMMPKDTKVQLCTALYRGPDTPVEDIPTWRDGLCEGVRVILRYSELRKSLDFCRELAKKGYKVFVQPMLTMRYSQEEIQMVLEAANDMEAFAVYFVDSYGYMNAEDVSRFFEIYNRNLDSGIRIGFHAHNNRNLAFANSLTLLSRVSESTERDIIIDSCIMGLGQGAGNLQTEIITDYLIQTYHKLYDYGSILDACEVIDRYWVRNDWGYSVTNFIPTRHKAAYKYAISMRNRYHLTYREIDRILSEMSYDQKQRYTSQSLQKILEEQK